MTLQKKMSLAFIPVMIVVERRLEIPMDAARALAHEQAPLALDYERPDPLPA